MSSPTLGWSSRSCRRAGASGTGACVPLGLLTSLFARHLVGVHRHVSLGVDVHRILALALSHPLHQVVLEHVRGLISPLQQLRQCRAILHVLCHAHTLLEHALRPRRGPWPCQSLESELVRAPPADVAGHAPCAGGTPRARPAATARASHCRLERPSRVPASAAGTRPAPARAAMPCPRSRFSCACTCGIFCGFILCFRILSFTEN